MAMALALALAVAVAVRGGRGRRNVRGGRRVASAGAEVGGGGVVGRVEQQGDEEALRHLGAWSRRLGAWGCRLGAWGCRLGAWGRRLDATWS